MAEDRPEGARQARDAGRKPIPADVPVPVVPSLENHDDQETPVGIAIRPDGPTQRLGSPCHSMGSVYSEDIPDQPIKEYSCKKV
jgi:hypothetical protein